MNIKRYLIAVITLFAFIFIYESFVHGFLLASLYSQTPTIWRNQAQLTAYIPFNIAIMALIAIWVTFIYTRLFKEGGWRSGLRFGLYFGILSGIQAAGAYYYLPISLTLAAMWFIANIIESLVAGFLIGSIYRQ